MAQKRSLKDECRNFQEKWKTAYFVTDVGGKPTCLICSQQITCKVYNVKRHYTSLHAAKYDNYSSPIRGEKIAKLEKTLKAHAAVRI